MCVLMFTERQQNLKKKNLSYRGVFELVIMNKYLGLKEGKLFPVQIIMSNGGLEV